MKLWEIIKNIEDGKVSEGDRFTAINCPFDLILEYNGEELIYNTIIEDVTSKSIVLCSKAEMTMNYIKVPSILVL